MLALLPGNEPHAASDLSGLYRVAGIAAFILIAYTLATIVQLLVLGGQPATAAEAFGLLNTNRAMALLRLDLPTIVALPLYYILFLGLFAALRRVDLAEGNSLHVTHFRMA